MKLYLGTPGWGWRLFGVGYKTVWFFGFSMKLKQENPDAKN